MWLVVSAPKTGTGVYSGTVDIAPPDPPSIPQPFNPANVTETTVGSATFTFSDGNNATFAYTVNGVTQSKAITREVFVASRHRMPVASAYDQRLPRHTRIALRTAQNIAVPGR